ncbi:MAG: SufD family Fe-S cluster assembly protein [Myxococcota bacterium]
MRPRPEEFERLLRKLGVCQDEHLVIAGRAANVKLVGRDTRADSISRAIARDRSKLFVRARLVGHHERSQGHLDCRGMVVSSEAEIHSIPELDSEHAPRARLSHDVAVGPIDEEAIAYLITRGVDPDEATAILTRGFLEEHSEVFAS